MIYAKAVHLLTGIDHSIGCYCTGTFCVCSSPHASSPLPSVTSDLYTIQQIIRTGNWHVANENDPIAGKRSASPFIYSDLLFARIQDVSDSLMRKTDTLLQSGVGVSVNEWRVLAAISAAPHASAQIVVAETGLDKSWVSRLIQSLQDRNLVKSEADSNDGRRKRLTLTDEGKSVLDAAVSAVRGMQSQLLNSFSATEHEALPRLLGRLQREMDTQSDP